MKKYYFLIVGFLFFGISNAQIVNIPDANFKTRLLSSSPNNQIAQDLNGDYISIDANNDGQIQVSEAIMVRYLHAAYANINNLEGIENFTYIKTLFCSGNHLNSLDVSNLVNLEVLGCDSNQMNSLLLNNLPSLKQLSCNDNQLINLNLSNLISLNDLDVRNNQLVLLSLNGLSNLISFNGENNQLTSLYLSGLINLQTLNCSFNNIIGLNLSDLNSLQTLNCGSNLITNLDVLSLLNLHNLICDGNQLTFLNVSNLINLQSLSCTANNLNDLIFGTQPNLQSVICMGNQIVSLDLSGLSHLWNIDCRLNLLVNLNLKNGANEEVLYFFDNPTLQNICADQNQLTLIQAMINDLGYSCTVSSNCSLSTENFKNIDLVISPNPVIDKLFINTQNIEVSSISIYNILGQLVQVVTNAKEIKSIDVSALKSGNYFIKIISDKGVSSSRFIKE